MYLFLVAKLSQTNKNISNNTLEDFSRKLEFSNAKNMKFQKNKKITIYRYCRNNRKIVPLQPQKRLE